MKPFYSIKTDLFLGPVDDYALAPVIRYASHWQIPIITTGGLAEAFTQKVFFFDHFIF